MPAYLVHGFRWPRKAIRVHIILNNIDDAAPEYIVSPKTSVALLDSLGDLHPETMAALPGLRFVEQYDPTDAAEGALAQPYAFVADRVECCRLSLNVTDTVSGALPKGQWDAMVDLREVLAPGAVLGWWMVYNGDELRSGVGDGTSEPVGFTG